MKNFITAVLIMVAAQVASQTTIMDAPATNVLGANITQAADYVQRLQTIQPVPASATVSLTNIDVKYLDRRATAKKCTMNPVGDITVVNDMNNGWVSPTLTGVQIGDYVYLNNGSFMGYVVSFYTTANPTTYHIVIHGQFNPLQYPAQTFAFSRSYLNTDNLGKFEVSMLDQDGNLSSEVVTKHTVTTTSGVVLTQSMVDDFESSTGLASHYPSQVFTNSTGFIYLHTTQQVGGTTTRRIQTRIRNFISESNPRPTLNAKILI